MILEDVDKAVEQGYYTQQHSIVAEGGHNYGRLRVRVLEQEKADFGKMSPESAYKLGFDACARILREEDQFRKYAAYKAERLK